MLELYYHPLASFCWKVLVGLYEQGTPFTPRFIDLGDPAQRAELAALWPFARFPVLRDRDVVVPESTTILEHLARHHGGVPADSFEIRARDRFFDHYVMDPMTRIVAEIRKPVDASIIDAAKQTLRIAYGIVDAWLASRTWACGEVFTMADCAAAPALFYANELVPIEATHARAYLERLLARPSMIRVRAEAQPYWHLFPGHRV